MMMKKYQKYKVKTDDSLKISGKASPKSVKIYKDNDKSFNVMVANNEQVRAGTQLINLATSSDRQNILNQISEIQTKINENYNQLNKSPNDPGILNDLAVNQKKYTGLENELYKYDREIYRRTHAIFDGKVKVLNENALDDKKPIVRLISNDTKIETVVSEYDLEKIQEGDSVNVKVIANGKKGK